MKKKRNGSNQLVDLRVIYFHLMRVFALIFLPLFCFTIYIYWRCCWQYRTVNCARQLANQSNDSIEWQGVWSLTKSSTARRHSFLFLTWNGIWNYIILFRCTWWVCEALRYDVAMVETLNITRSYLFLWKHGDVNDIADNNFYFIITFCCSSP